MRNIWHSMSFSYAIYIMLVHIKDCHISQATFQHQLDILPQIILNTWFLNGDKFLSVIIFLKILKFMWTFKRHSIQLKSFEPPHDKTNKMTVHPAKTQISLGICPVWLESSLGAQWVAKDPRFLHEDSEDSDQTGQMPRLIRVFAWGSGHFVGFVMRRLIYS